MRKTKREITDINEIEDLIRNMNTVRLGIHDEKYPYVVPVSFGYELVDGQLFFYFHGAKVGKKAELLKENPYICVEGDICYRFKDTTASVTCLYESMIAFGKAERLSGKNAAKGLKLILKHCGYEEHEINEKHIPAAVYKVTVESVTGKSRDKHN